MAYAGIALGSILVLVVLWDIFETIVLPRSVARKFRLTRLFYKSFWRFYIGGISRMFPGRFRSGFLNAFGPLSLLCLLLLWAVCLIVGFGFLQWGIGAQVLEQSVREHAGLGTHLYLSGSTFFTLGYGDITPISPICRTISVCEAGVGLGCLAVVIGYLPVIYQSFSRREAGISLLDARAGSPPTAVEMICRHADAAAMSELITLLRTMEAWCADILESHLSYPVLAYYRSQHDRESWLAALTALMDLCSLIGAGVESDEAWIVPLRWQAQLTYAMARHTIVDLALVFRIDPSRHTNDRLDSTQFEAIVRRLNASGIKLFAKAEETLAVSRQSYEPYVTGLAYLLDQELPPFEPAIFQRDNWETTAWDNRHI